jgi:hypothetical protein
MIKNNKISNLIEEFNNIENRAQRLVFEQKLSALLLELNQKEKDFLFENIYKTVFENIKNIGSDLSENQIEQVERILSLKGLSAVA